MARVQSWIGFGILIGTFLGLMGVGIVLMVSPSTISKLQSWQSGAAVASR